MNAKPKPDWYSLSKEIKRLFGELSKNLEKYVQACPEEERRFVRRLLTSIEPYFIWGMFGQPGAGLQPDDQKELDLVKNRDDTAVLSFAFGLTKEGMPGKSNEAMARVIKDKLKFRHAERVYVQWEIADALEAMNFKIPDVCIAWPPRFELGDIKEPYSLAAKLCFSADPNIQFVYSQLPENTKKALEMWIGMPGDAEILRLLDNALVYGLNALLENREFHKGISNSLRLPQLRRDLSYEIREFPKEQEKLNRGQATRINRFILESIFPEEIAPGKYLSSLLVLEAVLEKMKAARIKNIILVANPGHIYRCKELLQMALANKQMQDVKIYLADCTDVPYDENSAQSWTRDEGEFWAYDMFSRGRELLQWQVKKSRK